MEKTKAYDGQYDAYEYGLREFAEVLGIEDHRGQVLDVQVSWAESRVTVVMSDRGA